jgi:hypothetical protein
MSKAASSKRKRAPRGGLEFKDVCELGLLFPGIAVGTAYGTPALRVKGKFLCRLKEDGETLAIRCDIEERDARIAAEPKTYFITEHYRDYPAVLVRLAQMSAPAMRELIEQEWRRSAPKKLVTAYDRRP